MAVVRAAGKWTRAGLDFVVSEFSCVSVLKTKRIQLVGDFFKYCCVIVGEAGKWAGPLTSRIFRQSRKRNNHFLSTFLATTTAVLQNTKLYVHTSKSEHTNHSSTLAATGPNRPHTATTTKTHKKKNDMTDIYRTYLDDESLLLAPSGLRGLRLRQRRRLVVVVPAGIRRAAYPAKGRVVAQAEVVRRPARLLERLLHDLGGAVSEAQL